MEINKIASFPTLYLTNDNYLKNKIFKCIFQFNVF